ncbi:MAG: hypothetical protein JWQ73_1134 [Variovorax sp.]|jgi:hypothetical protein|nr:hypothetical protein [Variovorax sp.]
MRFHSKPRIVLGAPVLLALSAIALTALAQPTGNPKGTAAPSSQQMPKSPATGSAAAATSSGADSGKIDMGPASARLAASREAGTGTAGGLPKRNVGDGPSGGAKRGDWETVPTRQPTAPAR